jgi:hypothetical protein
VVEALARELDAGWLARAARLLCRIWHQLCGGTGLSVPHWRQRRSASLP